MKIQECMVNLKEKGRKMFNWFKKKDTSVNDLMESMKKQGLVKTKPTFKNRPEITLKVIKVLTYSDKGSVEINLPPLLQDGWELIGFSSYQDVMSNETYFNIMLSKPSEEE